MPTKVWWHIGLGALALAVLVIPALRAAMLSMCLTIAVIGYMAVLVWAVVQVFSAACELYYALA